MKVGDTDSETISRDEFVNALCTIGEPMELQQMHKYLCALMGLNKNFDPEEDTDFSFLPEVNIYFIC